ncbi:hypothetical protein [uncultured Kordia sp.]|uniref:P-loop ATPase, Sll1717 family n=1 Tax=uncultured Kordia sp. TaxID=507699 RepID=UPI0026245471|nr:hypothetical protein [uncultured Kordia sp.]
MKKNNPIQPFGERSFESEFKRLGEKKWEEYYFEHTDFVKKALHKDTYLIVGRRGCGKSSLLQHILFQDEYQKSDFINFGLAETYIDQLLKIANNINFSQELKVQKLVKLWEYIIWQIIFKKLENNNKEIRKGIHEECTDPSILNFIKLIIKGILNKNEINSGDDVIEMLTKRTHEKNYICARECVLNILASKPLYIAIDSREKYSLRDENEMNIAAALIQCACKINIEFGYQGLQIKVCVADEIFPYLKEDYITNTLKYVRYPLFMQWKPKDLIKLVCWRFFKYLKLNNLSNLSENDINWDSHTDILEKIWYPHFGKKLINRRGVEEDTFPYIVRHTHLRPRQLIFICNYIARISRENDEFPRFSEATIKEGVLNSEYSLADELINSYSSIYPNIGDIISALQGLPIEFKWSELRRAARRSATHWENGNWSDFIRLVIELGIIGRKREETNYNSKIIKADFEFALRDRLFLSEKDICVIHPLFYSKLNINRNNPSDYCVYPFPNKPEFEMMNGN